MSGSSDCPLAAGELDELAPVSRIQACAAQQSRPPENAMPTRWPTGREVRTLLTKFLGSGSWSRRLDRRRKGDGLGSGRGLLGQRQESSGQVVPALGVPPDQQHRVVAGDRAEDVGVLHLV